MTPQEFYAQYLPYAQLVSQRTGLDPRLVLAQSALETGYGKSAPNMNFFGIKSHGRNGGETLQTSEFVDGRMVSQPASFRGYDGPAQSFQDYAEFIMSNPRYEGVRSAEGLGDQIAEMAKSGYATDPQYGAKLANIASKFDPDSPPIIGADAMTALGLKPQGILTSKNTERQPMIAKQPQARGLLDALGIQKMQEGAAGETGQRFYERDTFKDTAASLAQGFAAMGSMPALQKMTADISKQRTEQKAQNKTAELLRANGYGKAADMVEQNLISGKDVAGLLLQKPKGLSDAEEKIQRLMSTGISRDTAIGIVDGSLVVSRDPVTGVATIVDKSKLIAQGEPPVIPPTETDSDVFKDTNVPGALGLSGLGANVLNTLVDAFGVGQPADKIAEASTLLDSLSIRTSLGLASEFPGRPSNLTREKIEALTIKSGEFGMGPDRALNMAKNMIRTLEESLTAANRVVQGRFSPTDQAAAKTSIDMLTPLLADYQSLSESLASKVTPPPSSTTLSPEVLKALERYNG